MKSIAPIILTCICFSAPAHGSTYTKIWLENLSKQKNTYDKQVLIEPDIEVENFGLSCPIDERFHAISKAAPLIIDRQTRGNHDFHITTGHGLVDENGDLRDDCYITDYQGNSFDVKDIHLAQNYEAGTKNDWAVVKTKRIKNKKLKRLALTDWGLYEDRLSEIRPTVKFSNARGLPTNHQLCQVLPISYISKHRDYFEDILAHNCQAIAGQSGSPLVQKIDQYNVLVGIHLGQSFTLISPETRKPGVFGYFRLVDGDMVDEINLAILDLQ